MKKKTLFGLICGMFLLLVASRAAHANSGYGYVCYANEATPSVNPYLGNYGGIWTGFTSGPSCTGSYLAYGYLCSTGATSPGCSNVLYNESMLNGLFAALHRAAQTNEKIYWYTDSNYNLQNPSFYAQGY